MTGTDDERVRAERARAVGLFRYSLVRQAADAELSTRARGRLVRGLAAAEHTGPFGARVAVSRASLDRWIRAWRAGGFDALVPDPRRVEPRTPAQTLELAAALKREVPERTAAHVAVMLAAHAGWAPGERTLQRHFARLGLNTRPDGTPQAAFGRFEAAARNELWTGDALHGPKIDGRKTYLFAFIDDHSRALVGYRWGHSEDTVRLEAALRAALGARGVPRRIYVDNGSAFVDSQLLRACASLGIGLVHSRPGQPAGRGKIERVFRTVREQFLVEIVDGTETAEGPARAGSPIADLAELNSTFTAWVEQVYHRRPHTETGQPPLARWLAPGPPTLPTREALHEAFLWSERRTVTKTATVSLHGNTYEVDAALVGHRVELVFDPFDLTDIAVRYQGRALGPAIPHRIGRHVHRKARPDTNTPPPAPTGIDYLHLVETAHTAELAARLRYDQLDDQHDDDHHDGDQRAVAGEHHTDAALQVELAEFTELGHQLRADGPLPAQPTLTDGPEPEEPDAATGGRAS